MVEGTRFERDAEVNQGNIIALANVGLWRPQCL